MYYDYAEDLPFYYYYDDDFMALGTSEGDTFAFIDAWQAWLDDAAGGVEFGEVRGEHVYYSNLRAYAGYHQTTLP